MNSIAQSSAQTPHSRLFQEQSLLIPNLLLGGLSILVCIACWIFVEKSISVYTVSQLAFTFAFFVNYPHFAASYMLLYSDFRKNMFSNIKYIWAGIIAPILLIGAIGYALYMQRADILWYMITTMYFLVGWHYVKQVFGVVVVTSAFKKFYYAKLDRSMLLVNLLSIWAISFFRFHENIGTYQFYGVAYKSFGLGEIWLTLSYVVFGLSLAYLIYSHVYRYIESGKLPASSAVVAIGSLYIWYLPVFYHPHFAYLIPFFHSLQYLVLVWFFKVNQVTARIDNSKEDEVEQRLSWVGMFVGYIVVAFVLGALFFEVIPRSLDSLKLFESPDMGVNPFLVAFLVFINIHHYFIDNVIWRSTNPEVKEYLYLTKKS